MVDRKRSIAPPRLQDSPAKMSAEVLPKAKKVTPAIFWDRPSVFEIMNKAGHRKSVAVTPVATNRVRSHRIWKMIWLVEWRL